MAGQGGTLIVIVIVRRRIPVLNHPAPTLNMPLKPFNPKRLFRRSKRLSPLDLVQCAAAFSLLFLALHLAGLREYTSILSGTVGSLALGWRLSAALAAIYVFAYLPFVVLVPILILAALILAGTKWLTVRAGRWRP
jgi:hypothetical protein